MKSTIIFCGRNRVFLTLIAILLGLIGCQSKYPLEILNSGDDSYVSLQFHNPYGAAITLSAGDEFGSVGYKKAGDTFWLKGQPTIKSDHECTVYSWDDGGQQITMQVDVKGKDKLITFKLGSTGEQPTEWLLNISSVAEEYFTGIFERVVDGTQNQSWAKGITTALNLRGERVEVKLKPTVSAYAPFYISSENYGISVHGTWPGVVDFCKADPNLVQISFEGPQFVFSIMMDETPAEIIKRRTMETGPPFKAPKWAFGPWRWRDDHYNRPEYYDGTKANAPYNTDLVEDILMMEAYDIPCTAYWIDRPWAVGSQGFEDYIVDPERLPEFEGMIKWLNNKDIELMMWIAPWVLGDMADIARERGYNLKTKSLMRPGGPRRPDSSRANVQGRPGGFRMLGPKGETVAFSAFNMPQTPVLMDYTNPEAVEWWAEYIAMIAKMGVKGFKLDRADGEILADSLHLITYDGRTYRENYNDYARQYVKATYNAVRPVLGDDFVLFPRVQYTGSAKYGAMWAGDTGNPAEGLRSAIIGMQRCSVMGYPLWSSDTGGYPQQLIREVTARWLGFSCFSPIMEVGPTNNRGFWGMNYEPSFDEELLATWRFYAKLRMSLVDYTYDMAKVASETGMPVARPLFLEYPEQKESWENWETYKFGDDLLVSVIWEEGKTSQRVYLPEGEIWINLWNNQKIKGGQYIMVDAQIYQIPVFLKEGSLLNLPDLNNLYEESVKITSVPHSIDELEKKEVW